MSSFAACYLQSSYFKVLITRYIPIREIVSTGSNRCATVTIDRDDETAPIARHSAGPVLSAMRACVGDTACNDRTSCLPEVQERILEPTTSAENEAPVS